MPFKFEVGEHVKKVSGDYHASGKVVSCFYIYPENQSVPRYVVRHAAEQGFFAHIYNGDQLVSIDRTVRAVPRNAHVEDTLTQRELAFQQGFTGDVCITCGGARMRRNGPCLVCEQCGSTTGCS